MALHHHRSKISTPSSPPAWRFLNRDGSFNIDAGSYRKGALHDLYHYLLAMSWSRLLIWVCASYLLINLLFGSAYYLAGPHALEGVRAGDEWQRFFECYFFSVQTLATIGYGRVSPSSVFAHILVTFEALTGLTSLALATGMVFARFSRPTARVIFSRHALITVLDGRPALIFRMANARLNQIAEAQVRLTLARFEKTREGILFRELYDLELDRDRSPIFSLTWTVVHWIDAKSPLAGVTERSLRESEAELLVVVSGIDDTFSQTVHARFSYTADEIAWNSHFDDVIGRTEEGKIRVHLDKLHDLHPSEQKVEALLGR